MGAPFSPKADARTGSAAQADLEAEHVRLAVLLQRCADQVEQRLAVGRGGGVGALAAVVHRVDRRLAYQIVLDQRLYQPKEQVGAHRRREQRQRVQPALAVAEQLLKEMRVEDRAGAVADRMHPQVGRMCLDQRLQQSGRVGGAASGVVGAGGVQLHHVPDRDAPEGPGGFLEQAVGPRQSRCPVAGAEDVEQQVADRPREAGLPDEVDREDPVGPPGRRLGHHVLDPGALGDEAAVGVEQQVQRPAAVLGPFDLGRQPLAEDPVHVGLAGLDPAAVGESAAVEVDPVVAEIGEIGPRQAAPTPAPASGGTVQQLRARHVLGGTVGGDHRPQELADPGHAAGEWALRACRGELHLGQIGEERSAGEAGAAGAGQLAVQAQRLPRQVPLSLHRRDRPQRGLHLGLGRGLAAVEIADHHQHEGAGAVVAVEALGAGRGAVEVAAEPDASVRRDGDVLGEVGPAHHLGVLAPHFLQRRPAKEFGAPRSPAVVEMHLGDGPGEVEGLDQLDEFVKRRIHKLSHIAVPWRPTKDIPSRSLNDASPCTDRFPAERYSFDHQASHKIMQISGL